MEVVYFLLPVAIGMSAIGVGFFIWALKSGQFEDLEGPRWRVIFEDDSSPLPRAEREQPSAAKVLPAENEANP